MNDERESVPLIVERAFTDPTVATPPEFNALAFAVADKGI